MSHTSVALADPIVVTSCHVGEKDRGMQYLLMRSARCSKTCSVHGGPFYFPSMRALVTFDEGVVFFFNSRVPHRATEGWYSTPPPHPPRTLATFCPASSRNSYSTVSRASTVGSVGPLAVARAALGPTVVAPVPRPKRGRRGAAGSAPVTLRGLRLIDRARAGSGLRPRPDRSGTDDAAQTPDSFGEGGARGVPLEWLWTKSGVRARSVFFFFF